jgi:5-dehydro-2-deoxygluconokinase
MPGTGGRATCRVNSLDVICLGRAAVDLYGQQIGGRLEDMQSFAKYLGGSSGNLAAGLARLGKKSAMLTRVGDEQMGRFVREELARQGVDVSHVRTDPTRLTGLVVLGIGNDGDIPHIFFRERCADMGVTEDDVDEDYIASSRALAITGTHLSSPTTRVAVAKAIRLAKTNGTRVVLDIDYRPVLWGIGRAGDGASRFAESAETSSVLQACLPDCDLIVGTEEEIAVAGASTDLLAALRNIRARSDAVIVLKRGADGCTVFDSPEISTLENAVVVAGFPVDVFNSLGAGDAFLSGFLAGWLEDRSWRECARLGNGCGALVVARHGCTPAMPSRIELDAFLSREPSPRQPRLDADLVHLHRATTWSDDPRPLCILAFDHRSQLEQLAAQYGRPFDAIGRFKCLVATVITEVLAKGDAAVRHGAIVDHRYGEEALAQLSANNIWTASPIEVPGSRPLVFDPHFASGQLLSSWPVGRVVKCLVFYRPDDPASLRCEQEDRVRSLYADIVALERRLILEIICPSGERPVDAGTLPRALRRLYNLGVRPDWWKLEAQTADGWQRVSDVIADCDPCCKGVVVLGLGAEAEKLHGALEVAASFDICRGFAVGRSIFADAAEQWFAGTIGDDAAKQAIQRRYVAMIDTWCDAGTAGRKAG